LINHIFAPLAQLSHSNPRIMDRHEIQALTRSFIPDDSSSLFFLASYLSNNSQSFAAYKCRPGAKINKRIRAMTTRSTLPSTGKCSSRGSPLPFTRGKK